jgi:hypothetical protein
MTAEFDNMIAAVNARVESTAKAKRSQQFLQVSFAGCSHMSRQSEFNLEKNSLRDQLNAIQAMPAQKPSSAL